MSWGCWRHENWYILGKVCEIKSYIDIAHLDLHVLLVSANDTVRNDTVQALLGCEINWNAHCQSLSFQCNGMIGSVSDPKRITFVGRACSCGCFWTGLKLKNSLMFWHWSQWSITIKHIFHTRTNANDRGFFYLNTRIVFWIDGQPNILKCHVATLIQFYYIGLDRNFDIFPICLLQYQKMPSWKTKKKRKTIGSTVALSLSSCCCRWLAGIPAASVIRTKL